MARIGRRGWSMLAVLVFHAAPLAAQDAGPKFEITPFAAYRVGGEFEDSADARTFDIEESSAFGLILNGPAGRDRPDGQWEFLYARQSTEVDTDGLFLSDPLVDIDIDHYQLGGVYLLDTDNLRPFVALTLGMSRFDPQPAEFDAESFFSASLGVGLQLNAAERFGLRLEARAYTTFLDSGSEIFCSSEAGSGSCLILVKGTQLTQWEARAGLVFRF